jgi:hypothetical protein
MSAAISERRPATDEIAGVIERVTFHNIDSGFCVLRVKGKGPPGGGHSHRFAASGERGEWLSAEGCWVGDREHELQVKASMMKTVPPDHGRTETGRRELRVLRLLRISLPRGAIIEAEEVAA